MAVNARLLIGRMDSVVNGTLKYTTPLVETSTNKTSNATLSLIASLVFAESKSVRTSTIILAAFNVLAAFTTAASILYDCYWASKRCNPKFKASKFCVSSIHPAETFPLLLAIGIVIQGIVFCAAQGQGLTSLFTMGCHTIAQFMFPALFIIPYLQVVFGVECAIRSFRSIPFQARGKWDVTICGATVLIMLIATWIPTHIYPQPDTCFASLVWFISEYGKLSFILLTVCAGLMIVSSGIIFTRLSYCHLVDEHQRIAASRMVYYLVVGIVSLAFIIPFYFSLIDREGEIKLSMMATVVLNLSGLMNGLLQLFLRSNTATTSFGKRVGRSWDLGKHDIRLFGPNELALHAHLTNPVTGPESPRSDSEVSWANSRASLVGPEKHRAISMEPLSPVNDLKSYEAGESAMHSTTLSNSTRAHTRKQSYSIFPSRNSAKAPPPTSIYDISDLQPPPALHFPGGSRGHKRDSSIESTATVQIGLRLSHAPTPSQEDVSKIPLPSTTCKANTLALPATTYKATSPSPIALPTSKFTTFPVSPMQPSMPNPTVNTNLTTPIPPARSPRRPTPSPLNTNVDQSPTASPTRTTPVEINKNLPPTPKFVFPQLDSVRDSNTQLSPAVYSPELSRKVSIGLGALGGGPRTPLANPLRANPLGNPKGVVRSNSGRAVTPEPRGKDQWI